jgi:hypothetical protein
MNSTSHAQDELQRFDGDFFRARGVQEIAVSGRQFDAVADMEALAWLALGVELGVFPAESADDLLNRYRQRLSASLEHVERLGSSKFFPARIQTVLDQFAGGHRIAEIRYAERLSSGLLDTRLVEMLIHEAGETFQDSALVVPLRFQSTEEWAVIFEDSPDPAALLSGEPRTSMDRLFQGYLSFIDHAGTLHGIVSDLRNDDANSYPVRELEYRVRAIHRWRVDLLDPEVRQRFVHLTAIFIRAILDDDELMQLGFDTQGLLYKIETVCAQWSGDTEFTMNIPTGFRTWRAASS